ncbi:Eco57I restriction-modification methylase domain-containing protein [Cellulomonas sp. McL0617]|uniref:Eco57I restriction-modification methylase domain-containing protein n=1 Tax=Cellulomonas sp. McL0617 TaxID=3415675 RepID=UPI003CEB9473
MSKKFDVVIGNPPYQKDSTGTATFNMPVYHLFMDAAHEVADKAVLITPARFLFNAGYTPKDWNAKMLADRHLTVPNYVPNSDELFPGTDIKGGIVVTYRDASRAVEPIGVFTKYPELNTILHRVVETGIESLTTLGITSGRSYRYTDKMHRDYPKASELLSAGHHYVVGTSAFHRVSFLYHDTPPNDGQEYVQVLGLDGKKRSIRWIRSEYVTGPSALGRWKVAVTKANGSGAFGESLSTPVVVAPQAAVTETFITIGAFDAEGEAAACLKYIKGKFARTMLGVLKITQDNTAKVWKYVPTQNFTPASDIDWSQDIPGIDAQLYAKYGLDDSEIAFIEARVNAME